MVMDTPAPDIFSSGTSFAIQEHTSDLTHSQTTGADEGSAKKATRKANKKAKKRAEKKESKKDKKKYRNEFNKIVKKLVEDGHVNGGESVVGDVTPGQINEPESSTVIWSPALAQQNNATMGIEDSEHMHDLLHSFLFGSGDDDSGPPLMSLGGNPQHIPHNDIPGTDSNYSPGQQTLSGNHTSMLLNIAETTTAIVDSGQTPQSATLNNIFSGTATPPTLLGQDPEGDDDDPHPTAKESAMVGGVDSTVKESDMAGVVDSIIKESGMAGNVDSTIKESGMTGNVDSTIKAFDTANSSGAGEDPKQNITIHVHHPPDRNRTLSLKRKWKKSCKRDYYNLPQGRQCCLRAVRCFDHLPEILEEIENYDDTQTNRLLVCSHVRSSLTCMSSTLKQKQCRSTAKAINEKFKPQLSIINDFFDPKCINTGQETTTTTPAPQGEGQTGSGSGSHINAGIIGASVGGFILIGLVLLIILLVRRKIPKRGQSKKKTSRDNDMNNKRESSRYKDMEFNRVQRQHSDVYAEIDERSMHSFRNPEMNGYLDPDGVRPLPSAPPDGTVPEDQQGYLTPQIRKNSGAAVVEEGTGGYTVLQSAEDGTVSYTTLRPTETDDDADYISPDEDAASPKRRSVPGRQVNATKPTPKPRQPSTGEEPYHAYFILEKENIEHV